MTSKSRNFALATFVAAGALGLFAGVASAQDSDPIAPDDTGLVDFEGEEWTDGEFAGEDWTGEDGTGEDWTGEDWTGEDGTGEDLTDILIEEEDGGLVAIEDGEDGEVWIAGAGPDLECDGCEVMTTMADGVPEILPRARTRSDDNASVHRSVHRGANICTTADLYVAWLCEWQGYAAPVN